MMRIAARILAIVGLIALGAGCFLFGVIGNLLCFDYCPADIPAALAHELLVPPNGFAWFFDGGMLLATLAWTLTLVELARQRSWRWFIMQVLGLPVALGLVVAIFWSAVGPSLVPHTEDEVIRWAGSFFLVLMVVIAWSGLTLRALAVAQTAWEDNGPRHDSLPTSVSATP